MCDYKCKYDGRKCNSNHKLNPKSQQNIVHAEKIVWNPSACACDIDYAYVKRIAGSYM